MLSVVTAATAAPAAALPTHVPAAPQQAAKQKRLSDREALPMPQSQKSRMTDSSACVHCKMNHFKVSDCACPPYSSIPPFPPYPPSLALKSSSAGFSPSPFSLLHSAPSDIEEHFEENSKTKN
jgi:hypothetical protein